MTEAERTELRVLQDRWLSLSVVKKTIRDFGEDHQIANPFYATDNPTFRDVRTMILPKWKQWFTDFFT